MGNKPQMGRSTDVGMGNSNGLNGMVGQAWAEVLLRVGRAGEART
jgi:hypothetical protein